MDTGAHAVSFPAHGNKFRLVYSRLDARSTAKSSRDELLFFPELLAGLARFVAP